MLVTCSTENNRDAVEILYDMVRRNLPDGTEGRFVCFTDDKRPYTKGIEKLPADSVEGTPFDLDICIVGPLDGLLEGKPLKTYSFDEIGDLPKDAQIITFPTIKPWQVKTGWVPKVYKIGGGTALELVLAANVEEAEIVRNIRNALTLPNEWLRMQGHHDGHAVIVGGGPSLADELHGIRLRQEHGQKVFATNNTYNYLMKNGIRPDFHVMMDAREANKDFIPEGATCYYSSQCHPEVLRLGNQNNKMILWHPANQGIQDFIGDNTGDPLVGGGTTIGLKSIALAFILGYREFHLYGFDSSYENTHHAYPQPLNDKENVIDIEMNGNKYRAAAWMCAQVDQFKEMLPALFNAGCTVTVHGTGLLPDVARLLSSPINFQLSI